MADITLFEVDLSESTFVAPLGRHVVADRVEVDDEGDGGGGRGKLLVVGALGAVVAVGGLAFVVARRFRGGDGDAPEETEWGEEDWSDDDWDDDGRFGFDETVGDGSDVDGAGDERPTTDAESFEADGASRRSGAVAAVVGLLFLLVVTALVRRRSTSGDATDEFGDEPEPVLAEG